MAIKALEQEPCEDTISRQAVKEQMIKYGFHAPDMTITEFIEDLPPVTSKQKTGYLVPRNSYLLPYKCSECGWVIEECDFCPHCGVKMIELQEGEKI